MLGTPQPLTQIQRLLRNWSCGRSKSHHPPSEHLVRRQGNASYRRSLVSFAYRTESFWNCFFAESSNVVPGSVWIPTASFPFPIMTKLKLARSWPGAEEAVPVQSGFT